MLPYSNNPREILKLHENSNVNYRGRYIYRIDEWIQPAGCKNEFSDGIFFKYKILFINKLVILKSNEKVNFLFGLDMVIC